MKIILNILIVMVKLCLSHSSLYNWHVKTIERDSDFGDDLKVQTALNKERQQDLLKISGKMTNIDYYKQINKNIGESNNKINDIKDNFKFDEIILQPNNKLGSKKEYENDFDDHSHYSNYKDNEKSRKTNENYDYANRLGLLQKDNHEQLNKELGYNKNKPLDDHNEDNNNNSYHYLKHLEVYNLHNSYKHQDKNEQRIGQLDSNSKNKVMDYDNNEFNEKDNKALKENISLPIINHCSGKYIDTESFVGTNLFDSTAKRCFSNEEVALLAIRKDFESLIPKDLPQCLFNDQMVALLLNYFYISHKMIIRMPTFNTNHLTQKAFYDTLGGYLNFYMVPVTKYSYYAGQISLRTAQQVLTLYKETKQFLNTNGNGWKAPLQNVLIELKSVRIEPLHIPELNKDTCEEPAFCMNLDMNTDENEPEDDKMIVQLPKLETDDVNGYLGNIWMPFRRKKTFDLKSESSAYVVVKFYETVTKCYRFEKIDQQYYNNQFKTWLLENINVHLSDEHFYPGLGAVLRIYEYLKMRKKITNIFENDLVAMVNEDDNLIRYQKPQIRSKLLKYNKEIEHKIEDRQYHIKKTSERLSKTNKSIESGGKSERTTADLTKSIGDLQPNSISEEKIKLEAATHPESRSYLTKLGTVDLTPLQIAVVAIPVVAIIMVITICCCKSFCKKKKMETQLPIKKNSSSSSSNLFNSPVRFFHIRKKSASGKTTMDYSSNEPGTKKSKKSVKIEKRPLRNSDTSVSSSPVRNKNSKDSAWSKGKGKGKDSGKK